MVALVRPKGPKIGPVSIYSEYSSSVTEGNIVPLRGPLRRPLIPYGPYRQLSVTMLVRRSDVPYGNHKNNAD